MRFIRFIAIVIVAAFLFWFGLINATPTTIRLSPYEYDLPLSFWLFLSFALGFLFCFVFNLKDRIRDKWRIHKLQRQQAPPHEKP